MTAAAGRLDGKVAVVTGGCSGIGLATVRRFREEGAVVVIGDVDDERGKELAAEAAGITYDSTDVSDYGVYDTSTIEKDMTAVVNASFAVE